jgi:hypothetical protein
MVILIDSKKERNVVYNIIIKQSIVIREIKKDWCCSCCVISPLVYTSLKYELYLLYLLDYVLV